MRAKVLPVFLFIALGAVFTATILATPSRGSYLSEKTGVRVGEVLVVCMSYAILYYASIRWARLTLNPYLFAAHFAVTALALGGVTHLGFIVELIQIWAGDPPDVFFRLPLIFNCVLSMFVGSFFLFPALLLAAVIKERRRG